MGLFEVEPAPSREKHQGQEAGPARGLAELPSEIVGAAHGGYGHIVGFPTFSNRGARIDHH